MRVCEPGQTLPVRDPVEAALGGRVVHRHAAADVDLAEPDAVLPRHVRRPADDRLRHRQLFGRLESAGQVGVDAAQLEVRVGAVGEQPEHRTGLRGVEAEGGGPAAHRQGAAGQRTVPHGEVETRQDRHPRARGDAAGLLGEHVQFVLALHVEALHAPSQRGRHLVRSLAGAAEGQRAARHRLGDMGEFAARGHLVAVDVRGERGQDLRLRVGLGRVVQLDALGKRRPHTCGMCP
ncbi:hypothetical protein SAV31267_015550 [Streptomyces avermitilis]|uniref:Uncharacterized protein n=1 Tax=Streptomyces avermitilis TaxID=33903 RepID=A0A4D4MJ72_STRAX|nr:hypothetical protein SAV31267_015550 [Streptomyces avermitilis]